MTEEFTLDPFDGFTLTDALRQMEAAFSYQRSERTDEQAGTWLAVVPTWTHRNGAMVNAGLNRAEKHYQNFAEMERDLPGLIAIYGNDF